jgi:hypothetical protein
MEINHITDILAEINNLIENNYFSGDEEIIISLYNIESTKKNNRDTLKGLGKYKKIKKDDDLLLNQEKCPICLEKFKEGEYKRTLPICQHVFHKKCVDKWLLCDSKECPICRTNYNKYFKDS